MTRILVVEDEVGISDFLMRGLRRQNFAPYLADQGRIAMELMRDDFFDLAILDLGLPDIDGQAVIEHARGAGQRLPIIVLTARATTRSVVKCLDAGADDYVLKPIVFDELLARVRARLRAPGANDTAVLSLGSLRVDARTRKATRGDIEIDLTAREYGLLETFLRHPNQVLSREQLLSQVWGYDFDPGSNVVEVYIGYLRGKLGKEVIETVRGMGYRLASDLDDARSSG